MNRTTLKEIALIKDNQTAKLTMFGTQQSVIVHALTWEVVKKIIFGMLLIVDARPLM
jgi:hypothetical protein